MLRINLINRCRRLQWQAMTVFALIALTVLSTGLNAQTLIVTPISSTACTTPAQCCYHFKFFVGSTTNWFQFIAPGSTNCWDWTCFDNQNFVVNPGSVTPTVNRSNNTVTITFNPSLTGPGQIEFTLCPATGCNPIGTSLSWSSKLNGTPTGSGTATFNACAGSSTDCLGCDQTIIYRINDCIHDVCYKRRSTSGLSGGVTITFNPALDVDCTPECVNDYPSRTFADIGIPAGWSTQNRNPSSGDISSFDIVPGPGAGLDACEELCITIPACYDDVPITVTMSAISNPNDCSPSPIGAFKQGGEIDSPPAVGANNSEPNYPNPVTSATEYTTIIPFSVASGGEAKINIMDESGKIIHSKTQQLAGGGKHSFHFSGSHLPSGKYYYTIESPLGAVIVKRTLLLVK